MCACLFGFRYCTSFVTEFVGILIDNTLVGMKEDDMCVVEKSFRLIKAHIKDAC